MLTILSFGLGVLVGASLIIKKGWEDIIAFVAAPLFLIIAINVTLASIAPNAAGGGAGDAGSVIGAGAAARAAALGGVLGAAITGLPAIFLSVTRSPLGEPRRQRMRKPWSGRQFFTAPFGVEFRRSRQHAKQKDARTIYYTTAIKLGALTAIADGRVDPREFTALNRVFAVTPSTFPDAAALYQRQMQHPQSVSAIVRPFVRAFGAGGGSAETLIFGMAQIAMADGAITTSELDVIRLAARRLGVKPYDTTRILASAGFGDHPGPRGAGADRKQQYQGRHHHRQDWKDRAGQARAQYTERERHLATLGLGAHASDQDIHKAWRRMAAKYHPDKLSGRDLPPAEMKKAERLMQDINAAYEAVNPRRN